MSHRASAKTAVTAAGQRRIFTGLPSLRIIRYGVIFISSHLASQRKIGGMVDASLFADDQRFDIWQTFDQRESGIRSHYHQ